MGALYFKTHFLFYRPCLVYLNEWLDGRLSKSLDIGEIVVTAKQDK